MQQFLSERNLSNWIACPECDLLVSKPILARGEKAKCPRCSYLLHEHKPDSLNRTLAVSLAGLLVFIPASTLPLLGLEAFGLKNNVSLLECILAMWSREMYAVAVFVFFFSIFFPLLRLVIMLYLALRLRWNLFSPHFITFFRYFHHLKEWGMPEVFMLGLIVTLYKLVGLADVIYGFGFLGFIFFLITATLVTAFLDEHWVWEKLDEGRE
ncbi:MAG: paraquat-inducible protein A [Pseudomonadales bacterium]|nr:paraquat-inducible protein A [Pseudomonadales bacterium]